MAYAGPTSVPRSDLIPDELQKFDDLTKTLPDPARPYHVADFDELSKALPPVAAYPHADEVAQFDAMSGKLPGLAVGGPDLDSPASHSPAVRSALGFLDSLSAQDAQETPSVPEKSFGPTPAEAAGRIEENAPRLPAGEGSSVGGTWDRMADVPEVFKTASAALHAVGDPIRGAVKAIPVVGEPIVGALDAIGAQGAENSRLLATPDAELSPEEIARKREATTNFALALTGEPLARAGGQAVTQAAGKAASGVLGQGAAAARRMFHGTGSAFETPNPATFDPNGLYGPGYYLTSEPRVADSYAATRATSSGGFTPKADLRAAQLEQDVAFWRKSLESDRTLSPTEREAFRGYIADAQAEIGRQQRQGPNVRAVDVPEGLNLLDADDGVMAPEVDRIHKALASVTGDERPLTAAGYGSSGERIYDALVDRLGTRTDDPKKWAATILNEAGYDGIKYAGGKRIPMLDEAGNAIEHDAYVVFPESLPKIRNAISGTAGGQADVGFALHAGSTAGGGAAGYASQEPQRPGESDEDYRARVAGATALGAAGGLGAARIAQRALSPEALARTRRLGITPAGVGAPEAGGRLVSAGGSPLKAAKGDTAAILDDAGRVLKEVVVKVPRQIKEEFLQPEAAMPPKTVPLVRQIFDRTRNVVGSMGEGGKELAERMHAWREGSEVDAAGYVRRMPTVKTLKPVAFENMVDVLEGKTEPINRTVAQAAAETKSVLDDIFSRAENTQVDVAERIGNYFPHRYKDDVVTRITDTKKRAELIRHLMDTRQAGTEEEAGTLLNRFADAGRDRRHGALEMERLANLPGYEKTKEALYSHILGATRRINEVAQFGRDDAIADRLITRLGAEGHDVNLAKDLFKTVVGADRPSETVRKLSSVIRAYNAATRLGLSAIGNVTQSANTASVIGVVRTAQAAKGAAWNRAEREFADKTGATLDAVIKELREGAGWSDKIGGIVRPGFDAVEVFNRRVAAIGGRRFAQDVAEAATNPRNAGWMRDLDYGAARQALARRALDKIGLDADAVVARGGKLTPAEEITAARNIVERTQFKVDPQDLPAWASHPAGKLVAQFKTFGYGQTAFVKRELIDEALKGNVVPLARFAVLGTLAQAAATEARNVVTGRDPEEDPGMRAVQYALGPLGLIGDVSRTYFGVNSRRVQPRERAMRTVAGFFGPTVGAAADLGAAVASATEGDLSPAARLALRQIPVAGPFLQNTLAPFRLPAAPSTPNGLSRSRDSSRNTRDRSRDSGR